MKKIYLLAAAAALFAACSSDKVSLDTPQQPELNKNEVGFDAYLQRSVTRAGATGDLTMDGTAKLTDGFGVFAYYTDNRDYDQLAQPNFMYNQKVYKSGGAWEYEPVVYWPNEYGNNAISDDNDRVTFFAYAPYVKVDVKTGKFAPEATEVSTAETNVSDATSDLATAKAAYDEDVADLISARAAWQAKKAATPAITTDNDPGDGNPGKTEWDAWQTAISALGSSTSGTAKALIDAKKDLIDKESALAKLTDAVGITAMTRNTAAGDPVVKYIGSFKSAEAVDLCWGVCPQNEWAIVNTGQGQAMTVGKPWINVERPSQTTQPLKFQFRHALAKMKVNIDAFVDATAASNPVKDGTKIWVRQIKFNGFTMKGALNLDNETANQPYWMNYNGVGDLESDGEVIIYDGRKDGKEGVNGAIATNEKSLGLNTQLIETEESFLTDNEWSALTSGVTKAKQNLFEDGTSGTGIFYVIPTGDAMSVEIIYDVETIDTNIGFMLADNRSQGTAIENRISKNISFGGANNKLEAGKAYEINLHLGLNSVEFDAEVVGWEDMTPADVDLPANVPFYTASSTGTGAATIPYDATTFQFGINGLNGGEAVNVTLGAKQENTGTLAAVSTATTWNSINGPWSTTTTSLNANASGYQVFTLTTSKNTTTSNRTQVVTWQGASSGRKVEMNFTQQAAPLALKAPASTGINTDYTLQRTGENYGFFCQGLSGSCAALAANGDPEKGENGIKVWRNGTALTYQPSTFSDPAVNTEFKFDDEGKLKLKESTQIGDVIKVTLKTGDAPAETISWTVQ